MTSPGRVNDPNEAVTGRNAGEPPYTSSRTTAVSLAGLLPPEVLLVSEFVSGS